MTLGLALRLVDRADPPYAARRRARRRSPSSSRSPTRSATSCCSRRPSGSPSTPARGGRRSICSSASIVALLVTDFVYGLVTLAGDYDGQVWLDVGWISFYLLWGAAALHPSMARARRAAPGTRARLTPLRLALLTVASLIAPAAALVGEHAPAATSTSSSSSARRSSCSAWSWRAWPAWSASRSAPSRASAMLSARGRRPRRGHERDEHLTRAACAGRRAAPASTSPRALCARRGRLRSSWSPTAELATPGLSGPATAALLCSRPTRRPAAGAARCAADRRRARADALDVLALSAAARRTACCVVSGDADPAPLAQRWRRWPPRSRSRSRARR